MVCTDQDVEYTNQDVVYIFHGDNLEIDQVVSIFVWRIGAEKCDSGLPYRGGGFAFGNFFA